MKEPMVTCNDFEFHLKNELWDKARAKRIPDKRFNKLFDIWAMPFTRAIAVILSESYSSSEFSAQAWVKTMELKNVGSNLNGFPESYVFKTPPMPHQSVGLDKMWGMKEFALFMEMRTGKTFTAMNWAAALALDGQINAMLVVCPTTVKLVWEEELAKHLPIAYNAFVMEAGKNKKATKFIQDTEAEGLKIFIMGIESFSQGGAHKLAQSFLAIHKTAMVIDESSKIKNHSSTRTKKCIDLSSDTLFRLILTGTPITQGLEDLYAQFRFLDWKIIGHESYYSFRNRYCIMEDFVDHPKIIGYTNTGGLLDKIRPYVYQVNLRDVVNLPEMICEKRYTEPTKEQKKALDDLGDPFDMFTAQGDKILDVDSILERMTRYQQIVGGIFPYDNDDGTHGHEPIKGKNPKIEAMMEVIAELPKNTKIIIWARFQPEIEFIIEALGKVYPDNAAVEFYGKTSYDDRKKNKNRFQEDPECLFFVANQVVAGMGLELAASSTHIYYSNSFSYDDRRQSGARTNSSRQKAKSILYVDICMNHKIDKDIIQSLLRKESIAEMVKRRLAE